LRERIYFKGLWKILKELRFQGKKMRNDRTVLTEKHHIIYASGVPHSPEKIQRRRLFNCECTYLVALLDIRIGVIIVHEVWLHLY
jgi:hypothetical protein